MELEQVPDMADIQFVSVLQGMAGRLEPVLERAEEWALVLAVVPAAEQV